MPINPSYQHHLIHHQYEQSVDTQLALLVSLVTSIARKYPRTDFLNFAYFVKRLNDFVIWSIVSFKSSPDILWTVKGKNNQLTFSLWFTSWIIFCFEKQSSMFYTNYTADTTSIYKSKLDTTSNDFHSIKTVKSDHNRAFSHPSFLILEL